MRPFVDLCDPPPNYPTEGDIEWALRKLRRYGSPIAAAVIAWVGFNFWLAEETARPVERVAIAEMRR